MASQTLLDRTYQVVLNKLIETGDAPHYSEIAAALGLTVQEGRKAVHALMATGIPGMWLFPDTDYISSFAPFSSLPTQYRISVNGEQKWYGQWGFESLAVSWLFPGKTVTIEAPCLDCNQPVRVEMRDGMVKSAVPGDIRAYVALPFAKWLDRLPFAWSTMNLFRSEEHVRNWPGFAPGTDQGIVTLAQIVTLFSGDFFRNRREPDYVSKSGAYVQQFLSALAEAGPFWSPPQQQAA